MSMNKIGLGTKVYTVLDKKPVMRSEMIRGKLERLIKPDEYEELEFTRIDFAIDRGRVGVLTIPTPFSDVIEYFQEIESNGQIVGFEGVKYGVRQSTPEEDIQIEAIITAHCLRQKAKSGRHLRAV